MAVGNNSTLDTTELMTGKDGKLFVEVNGVNTFLAEINEFKVAMNANIILMVWCVSLWVTE